MKHKYILYFLAVLFTGTISAQKIQSPSEFLGYKLGTHFTRSNRVIDYFKYVAENSDLVNYQPYGTTNELRTLAVAFVSSKNNLANIESIRKAHLASAGIGDAPKLKDKAIVWLSYNVHGNEASSTEAAMLTLYDLITKDASYLENTIVIIDPCINPDGRDRYVNWYNQMANNPYNTNPDAREHNEPWPGGRVNHYLFDLNRDWVWATQIETQSRLKLYNKWLPHVHVDFHEQGINNPYYFAPAAKPFHEIITEWQLDFQTQIGKNNAKYFDKNGWFYFTGEEFDLLYPSYGDTFPTYNGAIGMTYEQAGHGRAGLGIIKANGEELTLWDRLIHHTTTGLSTVEMAAKNAAKLNLEFEKYFKTGDFKYNSYVMRGNESKINKLIALLDKHEIQYSFAGENTVKGFDFETGEKGSMKTDEHDLIVSTNQPKGKLVKVLFEPQTKLNDSLTYDITAWSLPYAYGMKTIASEKLVSGKPKRILPIKLVSMPNAYAYTFEWNHLSDTKLLADLLQQGFSVKFSEKDMVNSGKSLPKGSLIITRSDNKKLANFDSTLIDIANRNNKKVGIINTGFSDKGPDMGSSSIKEIKNQKIAVLSGEGTSSGSFGEIQYFFEKEIQYPYTAINVSDFSISMLNHYHILILPEGYYRNFSGDQLDKLKSWIQSGGKVIAIGSANRIFANKKGFGLATKKNDNKDKDKSDNEVLLTNYDQAQRSYIKNSVSGAIFKTAIDTSHPLAFGYQNPYFTLKLSSSSYEYLKDGYNVVRLEDDKVVAGFAGYKTLDKMKSTLIFGEESMGRGTVIYLIDNPLFRGFWENGKLFFANAIFMVNPSMKAL